MAQRTYLLTFVDGSQKVIVIDENWKLTFGPMVPGGRSAQASQVCLRIYETKEKQRAIFLGIKEFRDTTIEIYDTLDAQQEQHRDPAPGAVGGGLGIGRFQLR